MAIKLIERAAAIITLAGALTAAAVALRSRDHAVDAVGREPVTPAARAIDAELARCNMMGLEALSDAVCSAIWQTSRRRFLETRDARREVPKTAPPWPTANSDPATDMSGISK